MTNNEIINRTQLIANTNLRNIGFAYKCGNSSVYIPDCPITYIHVFGASRIESTVIGSLKELGFVVDSIITESFVIFVRV